MNQQIKAHWLRELASADYYAGSGFLASRPHGAPTLPTTYSPLGVLCELAIRAGVAVRKGEASSPYAPGQALISYEGETLALPPAVAHWAELAAMPWVKLDRPSGIFSLSHIGKLGNGSFGLAIAAIQQHF